MTRVLLRKVRLADPQRTAPAQGDVLVVDRCIAAIAAQLECPQGAEVIAANGLVLGPALVDSAVFCADPAAAAAGGVTTQLLMPDPAGPLDDPALVERATRLGKPSLWVHPLAAATRRLEGRELAELALLRAAGAVAVATGRAAIADSAVMLRLLRYAAGLDLLVVTHSEDSALTAGAVLTEGTVATRLGLPAGPAAAEALALARDLRLAEEAGARLHIACVSTAEGVALVRAAKARGLDVTAGTAPPCFLLNEMAAIGWRSFARLSPPLRAEADRLAVREGLADGSIDMIASRHDPRTTEEKRLPFADAAPGAADAGLLLPLALTLVHEGLIDMARLFHLLSAAPAARFGIAGGRLAPGAPADLVLLAPDAPFVVRAEALPGLGRNTPFDGLPLAGQVRGLMKGGEWVLRP